jgi:hypothetical protein
VGEARAGRAAAAAVAPRPFCSPSSFLCVQGELLEEEAFAAIAADLQERLEMDIELPSREELRAAVQSSTRQLVEKRLVEYLQTNQNHLSMYIVPSAPVMRQMEDTDLIHGIKTGPVG